MTLSMAFDEESVTNRARADLARRLGINESEITAQRVKAAEFPDAALGAPLADEMSAQMLTDGWSITLNAGGRNYEYRATGNQLRLYNFRGENYKL